MKALIERVGTTKPDWWESVPLEYPHTLDLSWPQPGPGWNTSKHISHYVFSVINENPSRWRQGTKFLHHVLSVNKDNPDAQRKAMLELGHCYHDLLEDWARGAYWWQRSNTHNINDVIGLADCYWKLGCRELAVKQLERVRVDFTRYGSAIKLYSDMGLLDRGLKLAAVSARSERPDAAYMAAGDACRNHGQYDRAVTYYKKVLALPANPDNKILERNQDRAKTAIETIRMFETLDVKRVPDGTYSGTSFAYLGPLTVSVTVKSGRMTAVKIAKHKDKQYFSALIDTPRQILEKQSVNGVDATTGATITSEAVIHATARALARR